MNELFVSYSIACRMLELGYKGEDCIATIDQEEYIHIKGTNNQPRGSMIYDTIPVALYQQAIIWCLGRLGEDCSHIRFILYDDDSGLFDNNIVRSKSVEFNDLEEGINKVLNKLENK